MNLANTLLLSFCYLRTAAMEKSPWTVAVSVLLFSLLGWILLFFSFAANFRTFPFFFYLAHAPEDE